MKNLVYPFTLRAPAKINLRLEVGPFDGSLHTIVTVVAELGLADDLTFAPSSDGFHVHSNVPGVPEQENLAWRAARALGLPLPAILIAITKRVPLQAGLGGGSADAAAALTGLARIYEDQGLSVDARRLARAAIDVGSDVPSFLTRGLKIVSGVGDKVEPFPSSPPPWGIVLLQPGHGSITAKAYSLLDTASVPHELGPAALATAQQMCGAYRDADFASFMALLHNDFSGPIESEIPRVKQARRRLVDAGAQGTILCGSGSCVAGFFESNVAAQRARERVLVETGEWIATTSFGGSP